jgi:hypothetical protein
MSTKPIADLAKELRDEPSQGTLTNVLEGLRGREGQPDQYPALIIEHVRELVPTLRNDEEEVNIALYNLLDAMNQLDGSVPRPSHEEIEAMSRQYMQPSGGARRRKTSKFDRCVKKVRKTVKARKGSSKESAAIAICTTSVLHPRGRTLKRYRKGRLTTQKKFSG